MEICNDRRNFIIIGKYWISKTAIISVPFRFLVTNSETYESEVYFDYKLLEFIRTEDLDSKPLEEYFKCLNYNIKEEMLKLK